MTCRELGYAAIPWRFGDGWDVLCHNHLLESRRIRLNQHLDNQRTVFLAACLGQPFTLKAIVILPAHLHCIWALLSDDADFYARWHDIKTRFPARIPKGKRFLKAKGGMRFAFPPYGPTVLLLEFADIGQ